MKPFHKNETREERQQWFAHTPPWDRVPPAVINAVLDGITDKLLLEVFVFVSMENGLVARYERLDDAFGPETNRAQVSQILTMTGNRAIASLIEIAGIKPTEATKTKWMDQARPAYHLARNTFEPAIALAKNQVVAYCGLATAYAIVGRQADARDWAQRGLVELVEMRKKLREIDASPKKREWDKSAHPAAFLDGLDQLERQLRALLEA
jgi:hypothetical protein